MNNYIEIVLSPNDEAPLFFLWEKLYQQIHLSLVGAKNTDNKVDIGVSFPEYDKENSQLGEKLRLFANSKKSLELLNLNNLLACFNDYLNVSVIKDTPNDVAEYAFFKRIQVDSNNDRLARRMSKRKNISFDEALEHYANRKEKISKAPFIRMKSLSSDRLFPLLIDKQKTDNIQTKDGFSTYGLSAQSSVPIF